MLARSIGGPGGCLRVAMTGKVAGLAGYGQGSFSTLSFGLRRVEVYRVLNSPGILAMKKPSKMPRVAEYEISDTGPGATFKDVTDKKPEPPKTEEKLKDDEDKQK